MIMGFNEQSFMRNFIFKLAQVPQLITTASISLSWVDFESEMGA